MPGLGRYFREREPDRMGSHQPPFPGRPGAPADPPRHPSSFSHKKFVIACEKMQQDSFSVDGNPAPTEVRRLFVLVCGFEILPKSISTRNCGRRFILSEPVSPYLLNSKPGRSLLDAGSNPS